MIRTITIILFIISSNFLHACDCTLADIQKSYTYSSAIFYGKYLSTDTVKNFYDIFGRPYIVNNFEVHKFYRGIDSSTFNKYRLIKGNYFISLIGNCQRACGFCFEKDKMYLVYAYRDFYSGQLISDGCTRTREIQYDNFFIKDSFDKDFGKDENNELNKLLYSDTTEKYLTEYNTMLNFKKEVLESNLEELKIKMKRETLLLYLITAISLIIILILIFQLRQQRKRNTSH